MEFQKVYDKYEINTIDNLWYKRTNFSAINLKKMLLSTGYPIVGATRFTCLLLVLVRVYSFALRFDCFLRMTCTLVVHYVRGILAAYPLPPALPPLARVAP